MKIDNEFSVACPIDRAWEVLTDLEGIAPCLPGARLTGVDGDVYSGKVKVKVGPVVSDFTGTARFVEKDEERHRAVIDAKGRDARASANASALITAQLRADGDRTVVNVDTDLKISGKLAQFGSGMIKEVSGKLLGQFVTALEAKIAAAEPAVPAAPAAPAAAAPAVAEPAAVAAHAEPELAEPAEPAEPVTRVEATSPAPAAPPSDMPARSRTLTPAAEPEPLDLLAVAGGSVYKRLIPLVIGIVVIVAVIIWLAT